MFLVATPDWKDAYKNATENKCDTIAIWPKDWYVSVATKKIPFRTK
jgi:hypothetical protein